jgi:hypothetical protein
LLLQPIKDNILSSQIIDIDSGNFVESWLPLPSITDPQKMISATTYYRRATLQALLSLQAVDDDGNTVTTSVKAANPSLSEEQFKKAVDAISKGKYSLEQLRASYSLTKEQEAQL